MHESCAVVAVDQRR